MSGEIEPARSTVVRALVAAVPYVGGSAVILFDAINARRRARLDRFADHVAAGLTDEQLADFEELLRHDEQLQDLLIDAAVAAEVSRLESKRQALAHCVINGTFHGSADVETLVLAALKDIEEPHVRVLHAFARTWRELGLDRPDHVVEHLMWTMNYQDLSAALPNLEPVLGAILAVLVRHGMLDRNAPQTFGGGSTQWSITDFGKLILQRFGHDMRDYTLGVQPS